jgi:hypothetical protein
VAHFTLHDDFCSMMPTQVKLQWWCASYSSSHSDSEQHNCFKQRRH